MLTTWSNGEHSALKILNSDLYGDGFQIFELEVMQRVTEVSANSSHPGRKHVTYLKDHFNIESPSGNHVCLVMPVLGANIAEKATTGHLLRISPPAVKRIATQMLQALDFLNNECGVIHTDLQPSNILLDLTGQPPSYFEKFDRSNASGSILNDPSSKFCLNDLGIACFIDQHLTDNIQSPYLRAPEITLEAPWDPTVDTFSLGCLLYQFITGDLPFPGRAQQGISEEQDRIATLVSLFGPIPDVVLHNAARRNEFNFVCVNGQGYPVSLEIMLEHGVSSGAASEMTQENIQWFCDLLRRMLQSDPRQREGASSLLRHPWLATPEAYR